MTDTIRSIAVSRLPIAAAGLFLSALAMLPPGRLSAQQSAATDATAEESPPRARATVRVASGRTFAGFIDARTNGDTLWLRVEHGQTTLWRPIAWRRVVDVSIAGESMPGEAFRNVADRFASKEDADRLAPRHDDTPPSAPPLDGPLRDGPALERPPLETRPAGSVRSLSLDVRLANWDADADDDGLVAFVTPLDDTGRPTSATGTLTVDLIGTTGPRRPNWAATPRDINERRPVLETWTVQLVPDDFSGVDGSASVRLPFARGEPADDARLGSFGVVRARFAAPGADLVEAVIDPVRLRPLGKVGIAPR
ncbi:MAG: hypothetical protein WD875_03275 [Pirellulales bacterium]